VLIRPLAQLLCRGYCHEFPVGDVLLVAVQLHKNAIRMLRARLDKKLLRTPEPLHRLFEGVNPRSSHDHTP
jgi:hypothetical protein